MSISWHGASSGARRPLAALVAAVALLGLLVAPVAGVAGPTRLSDPSVAPRDAVLGTAITFSVSWRNREGSAPDHVTVLVDGTGHDMAVVSGTAKDGLEYRASFTLPLGTHAVRFAAGDARKFTDELDAGTVTVSKAPASAPAPSASPVSTRPGSTPSGSTTGSGGSTAAGSGVDGSSGGDGTASDGQGSSSGSTAGSAASGSAGGASAPGDASGDASGDPSGAGTTGTPRSDGDTTGPAADAPAGGSGSGSEAPGRAGEVGIDDAAGDQASSGADVPVGEIPDPAGAPLTSDAGAWTGGRSGGGTGSGGSAALPVELGGSDIPPYVRTLSVAITTGGAVTIAFAFALFGKKRRDGEPTAPDEVLSASAARGVAEPASGALVPAPAPVVVDGEAAMPRWRRPSLLEARKADPLRNPVQSIALTFDHGLVGPVAGLERRRIRYRVVRLLDTPDELLARDIGVLDEGDEVQLKERNGSFWRVLAPDGREGWIHRMVLGEVVGAPAEQPADAGDRDVDDDVLAAFLTARRPS